VRVWRKGNRPKKKRKRKRKKKGEAEEPEGLFIILVLRSRLLVLSKTLDEFPTATRRNKGWAAERRERRDV
jgi:hypothetical protein